MAYSFSNFGSDESCDDLVSDISDKDRLYAGDAEVLVPFIDRRSRSTKVSGMLGPASVPESGGVPRQSGQVA